MLKMFNKKLSFMILLFILMFSVPTFAMTVQHVPDYQYYKPVGWNVYTVFRLTCQLLVLHLRFQGQESIKQQ